ncbi:hypothetical protein U1769_20130 [Sphingomonas sp. ZT3P38]|uniref:hypothetical protein n=1 Tax=Parasphingomonas zepuensis TaxID=3096161 RepID=UPI002FC93BB3
MPLSALADIRSGSLLHRDGADAYYVLVGDIVAGALRTSRLADGRLPAKSGAVAALAEHDIVVAMRGMTNAAAVVPALKAFDRPIFATLDVAVIRTGDAILPAYLSWFLNLPTTQEVLSSQRSASAAPRLPLPALKNLAVPLPTLARQAKIAAAADEGQRERNLMNKLQQSRQRLLDDLLRQAAGEVPTPIEQVGTDHRPSGRRAATRPFSGRPV